MNIKSGKSVYIIGIGGKGLNSIAEFCVSQGYQVKGSDIRQSPEIDSLIARGVGINLEQTEANIVACARIVDVVVYSSIIKPDHPELSTARRLGIRTLERARFLGELTSGFARISVAGSHGKSTTSALATLALKEETGAVNSITGAYIKELQSYQCDGDSPYCVLEACEYGKSFLHMPGDYTLITSLEKSHMEFFGSEEKMNEAFSEFVRCHNETSSLIINGDIPMLRKICSSHPGKVITCGFNSSNDYVIRSMRLAKGVSTFSVYKGQRCVAKDIVLKIPGTYNALNVTLVIALLLELGLRTEKFITCLDTFTGVGRRFEIVRHDQTVYVDDFAHHPTQVHNLLKGLRQFFPHKNIFAVFEPRQYHLIKTFLREYGKSFGMADAVYVTDIVPALGDTARDIESLATEDIIRSVRLYSRPKSVEYVSSYEEVARSLSLKDLSNAVVATIGAGGIFRVRDLLINRVQ